MIKSWRTSLLGVACLLCAAYGVWDNFHGNRTKALRYWKGEIALVATGLGLLMARDNKVTSEQAGAKDEKNCPD